MPRHATDIRSSNERSSLLAALMTYSPNCKVLSAKLYSLCLSTIKK